eukprot:gene20839-27671_t
MFVSASASCLRPACMRGPRTQSLTCVQGLPARVNAISSTRSPLMSQITPVSQRTASLVPRATEGEKTPGVVYNKEFGYSRKDVILIGVAMFATGYGMYYGLQATGMESGMAGNWVQLIMILGLSLGWVSTYIFRVATKQMTYVKQLEQYEEAVMRKRLDEMTEAEIEDMVKEAEAEKVAKGAPRS